MWPSENVQWHSWAGQVEHKCWFSLSIPATAVQQTLENQFRLCHELSMRVSEISQNLFVQYFVCTVLQTWFCVRSEVDGMFEKMLRNVWMNLLSVPSSEQSYLHTWNKEWLQPVAGSSWCAFENRIIKLDC